MPMRPPYRAPRSGLCLSPMKDPSFFTAPVWRMNGFGVLSTQSGNALAHSPASCLLLPGALRPALELAAGSKVFAFSAAYWYSG